MGNRIAVDRFEEKDYARFSKKLEASLAALQQLLGRPGFGRGAPSLGAELEMFLVTSQGRPATLSEAVLKTLNDNQFTPELDRFNLEYNASPLPLAGSCLRRLEDDLRRGVRAARAAAKQHAGAVAIVGILPTLQRDDFSLTAMSNRPRYRALAQGLVRARHGELFHLKIDGEDPLELHWPGASGPGFGHELDGRVGANAPPTEPINPGHTLWISFRPLSTASKKGCRRPPGMPNT